MISEEPSHLSWFLKYSGLNFCELKWFLKWFLKWLLKWLLGWNDFWNWFWNWFWNDFWASSHLKLFLGTTIATPPKTVCIIFASWPIPFASRNYLSIIACKPAFFAADPLRLRRRGVNHIIIISLGLFCKFIQEHDMMHRDLLEWTLSFEVSCWHWYRSTYQDNVISI